MTLQQSMIRSCVAAALLASWVPMAIADKLLMPAKVLPAYKNECASCHMAYPPAMLSKPAWQRIMGSLEKHYGTDASVDAVTERQIGTWLQAEGGSYKRVEASSPADRLSTTQWFEKKHRKIEKTVWTRKSINGKAQCQACHQGAEIGDFEDDRVRIPL
jgi:nitrate/TMAO reductase-like tetraheme cytochrome c subunit